MSKLGDDRAEPLPESIDWKSTSEQLVAFARRRHRLTAEEAEQDAQEAIRRFFDPDYVRFDPAAHGTLLEFLGSIVNAIVANRRRRGSSSKAFLGWGTDDGEPMTPEDIAIAREHAGRVVAKLVERTERAPVVARLLAVLLEGVEGIENEAERVGVSVAEIEKARRRLKAHVEVITNSLGEN